MLEETFIFLPGVQEKTERHLWDAGITTWDHLLDATAIQGVSKQRLQLWKSRIRRAQQLKETDEGMIQLIRLLGSRYAWRAYNEIMDEPRFLDIETTEFANEVTVVGVSDGDFYQAAVRGNNLDTHQLRVFFAQATCLITFNGSSFDLPVIAKNFPSSLPEVPHLDLRHICSQAGLTGGLKKIEQQLLIRRAGTLRDVDGTDAIMLWHRYQLGDNDALQELVDYNAADVLNLKPLLELVIPPLWNYVRHGDPLPFKEVVLPW